MTKNHRLAALWLACAFILSACGAVDQIKARTLAREGNEAYRAYDYRGAITKYREAAKLDPEVSNLYLNLGYAYFSVYDPSSSDELEKGAAREAVRAFDEHLKRNPEDEAARNFQVKIMIKAAPEDTELSDRAYRLFLSDLEKDPKNTEARQYLVTLFIDCKRYEDAVKFFAKDLAERPEDAEIMKILAIIADKSNRIQEAVDWYWKRATTAKTDDARATYYYEVGTYAWNLLHYSPNRVSGAQAVKLADQGIQAVRLAMSLKDKYAEAMVYGNLLYLKRMLYESEEMGRYWDSALAYEMRSAAGLILAERKKEQEGAASPEGGEGSTPPPAPDGAAPQPPAPPQPPAEPAPAG